MAPRPTIRTPTNASIPNAYKIPSTTRSLVKSLSRLSRASLIELVLEWLEEENQPACIPYLAGNRDLEEEAEEDYLHTPAESLEELRGLYQTYRTESAAKRDIVDRILDGDWRRGISLQQLAMIDFRHLRDHESSLRWTALNLVPLTAAAIESTAEPLKRQRKAQVTELFPRVHPSAFIQALKHQISPMVQAHYYLHRLPAPHNLTILRLYVSDTPYANPVSSSQSHFTDSARILYVAFPDSCPYVYVSLSGSAGVARGSNNGAVPSKIDIATLKRTVLEAVPKALSRPHQRYALEATSLTAKNLRTMSTLRGNGRSGASQGAYSIFADASAEEGPLEVLPKSFESKILAQHEDNDDVEIRETSAPSRENKKRKILGERDLNVPANRVEDRQRLKKRKIEVARRFGTTGLPDSKHRAPIDRLHIKVEADITSPEDETVDMSFSATAEEQSTKNVSENRKKDSVLNTFDRHKHASKSRSQAPPRKHAQYNSSTQSMTSTPPTTLTLTFHGTDVFAGIRTLAEMGFVDLDKMPSWMTGEEGVSIATVRNGVVVDGWGGGA